MNGRNPHSEDSLDLYERAAIAALDNAHEASHDVESATLHVARAQVYATLANAAALDEVRQLLGNASVMA